MLLLLFFVLIFVGIAAFLVKKRNKKLYKNERVVTSFDNPVYLSHMKEEERNRIENGDDAYIEIDNENDNVLID